MIVPTYSCAFVRTICLDFGSILLNPVLFHLDSFSSAWNKGQKDATTPTGIARVLRSLNVRELALLLRRGKQRLVMVKSMQFE